MHRQPAAFFDIPFVITVGEISLKRNTKSQPNLADSHMPWTCKRDVMSMRDHMFLKTVIIIGIHSPFKSRSTDVDDVVVFLLPLCHLPPRDNFLCKLRVILIPTSRMIINQPAEIEEIAESESIGERSPTTSQHPVLLSPGDIRDHLIMFIKICILIDDHWSIASRFPSLFIATAA